MIKSFKKGLALVLAAAMVFSTPIATNSTKANAEEAADTGDAVIDITDSADLNDTVGNGEVVAWWSDFSKSYRFDGDFDATFKLVSTSDVAAYYHTPTVVVTTDADRGADDYKEYVAARSDNWCNNGGDWTTKKPAWETDNASWMANGEWDGWKESYKDVTVNVRILKTGNKITITEDAEGNKTGYKYQQIYVSTPDNVAEKVRVFFCADTAKTLEVKSVSVATPLIKNGKATIAGNNIEFGYALGNETVVPDSVQTVVSGAGIEATEVVADAEGKYTYEPKTSGTYDYAITAKKADYVDATVNGSISVAKTDSGLLYDYELAKDFKASKSADAYTLTYSKLYEDADAKLTVKDSDGKEIALDANNAAKFASLTDGKTYTATLVVSKEGYVTKTYTTQFTYTAEKREEAGKDVKRTEINKTLGKTDLSSAFWTEFEPFKIEDNKKYTFVFENHGTGKQNYQNFVLAFANGTDYNTKTRPATYTEYAVVRADNYAWIMNAENKMVENTSLSGKAITYTNSITDPAAGSTESWAEWLSIIKDSDVTMNVIRSGSEVKVEATIVSQADKSKKIDWTASLNCANADGSAPNPLYMAFTVDSCYLNLKYVDEQASNVKLAESNASTEKPKDVTGGTKKSIVYTDWSAKYGAKKVTGELNISGAKVTVKVGKKKAVNATVKGKTFTAKVAKLTKGTKVVITATKDGYQTATKTITVKAPMKVKSVTAKKGTKKVTGTISVKGATVKVKVGKKAYKKAKVKGKKFTLKVAKLKKGTKVKVQATKKNYKTATKTVKVK